MMRRDPQTLRARLGQPGLVVLILLVLHAARLSAQTIHDMIREADTAAIALLLKQNPSLIEAREFGDFTPMKTAVRTDNPELVRFLLRHGAKPDLPDRISFTPLEEAIRGENAEIACLLLEAGADPNTLNTEDATAPLQLAAIAGNDELVRMLLAHRAKVDIGVRCTGTPLMEAAEAGHLSTVKILVQHGARLETIDGSERRPLDRALRGGNIDVVRYLLNKGARAYVSKLLAYRRMAVAIDHMDLPLIELLIRHGARLVLVNPDLGGSLLAEAAYRSPEYCKPEIIEWLLAHGAGAVERDTTLWPSALVVAADWNNLWLVRHLIERGDYPDLRSRLGLRSLMNACRNGDTAMARLLLDHGAHVNDTVRYGETPLMNAASAGNPALLDLLLERGAKLDAKTDFGGTALWFAVTEMDTASIRWLARHVGIDPRTTTSDGDGLLHSAAWPIRGKTDSSIVEMLLAAGTPVDGVGKQGRTPLMQAAAHGDSMVVGILLAHGANAGACSLTGVTPLMEAAEAGSDTGVAMLLHAGASVANVDDWGFTALHSAVRRLAPKGIRRLLEAGADPTLRDQKGRTPLDLALFMKENSYPDAPYLAETIEILRSAVARWPAKP